MSYIPAIDVSQYQGNINWGQVPQPIAIIKMSGGDAGLYFDSKANTNYYNAVAAGKAVGCYHFAGGTDPIAEANFFIKACSPLVQNDVLVLDWEVSNPDPVGWCNTFLNHVHDQTGVWPLIYMNGSTVNSHDWSSVFKNCGLWVANWNNDPDGPPVVPVLYVMHQYTSDGSVPGISGRVDLDAWYGSVDDFKKYGYQVSQPTPPEPTPPDPVPEPIPPEPTPEPPIPDPPTPDPIPEPIPEPPTPYPIPAQNWATKLINWLKEFFGL